MAVNVEALHNSSCALLWVWQVHPSPLSRTCFAAAISNCPAIHVHGVVVMQLSGEVLSQQQLSRRFERCQERYPTAPMLILANPAPADMCFAALTKDVTGY